MQQFTITPSDPELIQSIINHEGSKAYQQKIGTFKNGKFLRYKDTRGFWTIGYGHLITTETFTELSDAQAEQVLISDVKGAVLDAGKIYRNKGLDVPENIQRVLVEMCFQLGYSKVLSFSKFLAVLKAGPEYLDHAAAEMRDSAWYKQTPNRVEALIKKLK